MDFLREESFIFFALTIVGIIVGVLGAIAEGRKLGIPKEHVINCAIPTIIVGIITARLFHILANLDTIFEGLHNQDVFLEAIKVNDGLNVFGALIGGGICVALLAKKLEINIFKGLDICAPAVLLGMLVTNISAAMIIGILNNTDTSTYMVAFAWAGLGFGVISVIRRLKTSFQVGDASCFVLIWLGYAGLVVTGPNYGTENAFSSVEVIYGAIMLVVGLGFGIFKHVKNYQDKYHEAINFLDETKIRCFVFDLDQTIIESQNLINAAYGETISQNHGLSVYDDPQVKLDGDRLKKYVQFTKEHHALLTKLYRGVLVTLQNIQKENNEIIFISKLPADAIAVKIQHFGLNSLVNRFINSNDIAKLGKQYPQCSVMVVSSDRELLVKAAGYGFKTAYSKFANPDTTGVVSDEVLEKIADTLYII